MEYIDAKFKDLDPQATVEKIQHILQSLEINVQEEWFDSQVEGCYSLSLIAEGGVPRTNGKGVTKEFARASAYGEFIERLQSGLMFYKYQSVCNGESMNVHRWAPDAKYMTEEELVANGDWMDHIIETYKGPFLSRQTIAGLCSAYACADDGKILTLPFYSIFEDKYVYLPMAFVDQMYKTNGCCAGNTREEAWVHALSEMMERHASVKVLTSGCAAPKISDDVLMQYPVVAKILNQIRKNDDFQIDVFDYSIGNGFPIISTRIINKKTQGYRVNVAADPVLEIAIQRTLTELMQGKNLDNVTRAHSGKILKKVTDVPLAINVLNQRESSAGLYTADYFANELTCQRTAEDFCDNSGKTNQELLQYMLSLYKDLKKPVYVRNFSYLGFVCYRFVVPGFSESDAIRLNDRIPIYAIADAASKAWQNPAAATNSDLRMLLTHSQMMKGALGRYDSYSRLSGVPLTSKHNRFLSCVIRAYAEYRLNNYKNAINYIQPLLGNYDHENEICYYFACVNKYLELTIDGIDGDKIRSVLYKFFRKAPVDQLYNNLDQGKTPYDDYLICCDFTNCESCKYRTDCCYDSVRKLTAKVGAVYQTYVDGQNTSKVSI